MEEEAKKKKKKLRWKCFHRFFFAGGAVDNVSLHVISFSSRVQRELSRAAKRRASANH